MQKLQFLLFLLSQFFLLLFVCAAKILKRKRTSSQWLDIFFYDSAVLGNQPYFVFLWNFFLYVKNQVFFLQTFAFLELDFFCVIKFYFLNSVFVVLFDPFVVLDALALDKKIIRLHVLWSRAKFLTNLWH